jgi:hypothetical protein
MRLSLSQRLQRHCMEFWAYRICALFWRCIPLVLAHFGQEWVADRRHGLDIRIVQVELVIELIIESPTTLS